MDDTRRYPHPARTGCAVSRRGGDRSRMPLLADPHELFAAASRLHGHAEVLRCRAVLLAAAVDGARWFSPAATLFRARATDVAVDLRRASDHVAAAADAIRAHAAAAAASPLAGGP